MAEQNIKLLKKSYKYKNWTQKMTSEGFKFVKENIYAVLSRNGRGLFTAFLDYELKMPDGENCPRQILLKGDSAIVIPLFHCTEDNQYYTLFVEQRRIGMGGEHSLEFPGGMVDEGQTPQETALKELREELGIQVQMDELSLLFPSPLYVCTSMLDERIYFYYFEKEMALKEIMLFDGKHSGVDVENEFLTIRCKKISEAWKINNVVCSSALKLLEENLNKKFH